MVTNKFNKKICFLLFLSITLLLSLNQISSENTHYVYYKLSIKSISDNLSISNLDVVILNKPLDESNGLYKAAILDNSGKELNKISFDLQNLIYGENIDNETGQISSGEWTLLNRTELEVYIPYNEKAKQIVIYNNNSKDLVKKDISMYSKPDESKSLLEENVKNNTSNDNKLHDEAKINKNSSSYLWILGIIISLFIIFFVIWIIKKKHNKNESQSSGFPLRENL